jgi:PAS domain S-box-containing protein
VGVSLTLAVFHAWNAGRDGGADWWVATWAVLAVAFELARWAEIHTTDHQMVIEANRVMVALGPLLICTMVGFVRRLTVRGVDKKVVAFTVANLAIALAAAFTPWFVTNETVLLHDAFGRAHQAGITTPAIAVIGLDIPLALAWVSRDIWRATSLGRGEKGLLLVSLVAYALLGLTAIAAAVGVDVVPSLAEYGPLVMAFSFSYLLVTQRRRLESELEGLVAERSLALRASEERFRNFFDEAPIGVFFMGSNGSFRSINPKLVEIVGAPSTEAMFTGNGLTSWPSRESGIADAMRRCLSTGEVVTGDYQFTSRWMKRSVLRVILTPARDVSEAAGVLGLVEDISDQVLLEAQLRQSQKLESVGQLAAGVAHEINNPMAYVRSNLGQLRSDWDDVCKELHAMGMVESARLAECEGLIDDSLEGVDRTIAIARDMREFAHAGSEDRTLTHVNALVETCVRFSGAHRAGSVSIDEVYGDPHAVMASPSQLQQVVVNLLVNALQAVGESGQVRIETGREGNETVITVDDDGAGVSESARERLFDPFFTTKEAGEGTGLGLYVSYQIIQAHAGTIVVGASPAGGARFEIRLPAAPASTDGATN